MQTTEEIIAAFVDDERVDAEALARALAKPEGREYLIDVLAMRELTVGAARVEPATHVTPPSSPAPRLRLAAAAAALLVACSAGGYFAGLRLGKMSAPPAIVAPATPEPGAAQVVAPAPTSVIRLQSGVDWTEKAGGH